jgi:hypothetical protein
MFLLGPCRVYKRGGGGSLKEQDKLENWNWKLAVESTRTRMERVIVICEVGRLAIAL